MFIVTNKANWTIHGFNSISEACKHSNDEAVSIKIYAGDFEAYRDSMPSELIEAIGSIREEIADGKNLEISHVLMYAADGHIVESEVYVLNKDSQKYITFSVY